MPDSANPGSTDPGSTDRGSADPGSADPSHAEAVDDRHGLATTSRRPGRGPTLENRLPREGINTSDEHPLREFGWLIGATIALVVALVVVVGWGTRWLAPMVPFRYEDALARRLVDSPEPEATRVRSAALQVLADKVAARMDLPAGMTVQVRFEPGDLVNAYATIGGRLRVYRGLIDKLDSEDALAALLAHEIAHVRHRHVAASLGHATAITLMLSVISSEAGARAAGHMIGNAAGIVLLGYSRAQEEQSDDSALAAVVALYGHAGGVSGLFRTLTRVDEGEAGGIALLRSHPLTQDRLDRLAARARQRGWALEGTLTPMPPALIGSATVR